MNPRPASRKLLKAALPTLLALGASVPVHAFQTNAHTNITEAAGNEAVSSSTQAPDLVQYRSSILNNSAGYSAELKAHGGPDNVSPLVLSRDGGPFDSLISRIQQDYGNGNFPKAYAEVGFVVHLIEDQNSPAHSANIGHTGYTDHFESQSANVVPALGLGINDPGTMPPIDFYTREVNINRSRLLPSYTDSNGVQYWIPGPSPYDGLVHDTDGSYGCWPIPLLPNMLCDHFSSNIRPDIIPAQVRTAVMDAAGLMLGISRMLPPLIQQQCTVTPANFNGTGTLSIQFHAMENRTQSVYLSAKILDASGNETGHLAFNNYRIDLSSPGPNLPWEADVNLTWNGVPTDNFPLAGGTYLFGLTLVDGDQNSSPALTPAPPCSFTLNRSTPTLGLKDAAGNILGQAGGPPIVVPSTIAVVLTATAPLSGIASISLANSSGVIVGSATFAGQNTVDFGGGFINLAVDTYSAKVTDLAGNSTIISFNVIPAPPTITLCFNGHCSSQPAPSTPFTSMNVYFGCVPTNNLVDCPHSQLKVGGQAATCGCPAATPPGIYTGYGFCETLQVPAASVGLTVSNLTAEESQGCNWSIDVDFQGGGGGRVGVGGGGFAFAPGQVIAGHLSVPQLGQIFPNTSADGTAILTAPATFITWLIYPMTDAQRAAASSEHLIEDLQNVYEPTASQAIAFNGPASVYLDVPSFSLAGVATDTTTLAIYQFAGTSWSSAPVTNQSVTRQLNGTFVVAGSVTATAPMMAFFLQRSTAPPRTTLSIGQPQYSNGTVFVTSATVFTFSSIDDEGSTGDGLGFGVASQRLFIDGVARATFTNPSPAVQQTFVSTFSLTLDADGPHVLTYYAQDVKGVVESMHTTTVTYACALPRPFIV